MKKKLIFCVFILTLMLTLPAFSGTTAISPEELYQSNFSTNSDEQGRSIVQQDETIQIDNTKIDITNPTEELTQVILNDTYRVDIEQKTESFQVNFTELDSSMMSAQADSLLMSMEVSTDDTETELDLSLPTGQEISIIGDPSGSWFFVMDDFLVAISEAGLYIYSPELEMLITRNAYGYVDIGIALAMKDSPLLFVQTEERGWEVDTNQSDPHASAFIEYYPEAYYAPSNYSISSPGLGTFASPLPAAPFPPTQDPLSLVWFTFVDTVLLMTYGDITVTFYQDQIVITYVYISITIYFWIYGLIERIIIMFFEFTFIFYFTIIELILVIIYECMEIKYYYSQIVIIYESIEIILVFISITIWQLIIIWHFEFWFIQLIFIINVNVIIIQPIRFIFIPVIIPVFIPIIYYVPVYINQYVHIYVPYAASQIFIDIYDEDLQKPNHTISYYVYDQLGNPINDADVSVNYNSTDYDASFIADGVYEVEIPASNDTETITVTATKPWYPDGTLTYDLTIDWVIETVTEEGPVPIISILASLFTISICAVAINRKKKN